MALSGLGNNDFRIKKKLSHRTQGRTYIAELLSTQELFVMKKEEYLSEADKARVQLQIDQMKRLNSKFTVRLVCSFQFDVDMCIVMELFSQVTRSLDHLHTNNVIHQKIKPENIFVNTDGSIRLGSFGIAQQLNEKDCLQMGSTMVYLAPEVWLMKRCDFFSNIFSCGIIAAELLTGKHPFFANNELAIVERVKKGSYDQLPAFVPNDLKELIESMIDADFFKRPTTKQIMSHSTIDQQLRMQLEKEKSFEVAQNRAKSQSKLQSSSIRVVSVPTVDEQGYQSYTAQPDPQYLQAVHQQHAYYQAKIPQQNQIQTISSVPVLETVPSNSIQTYEEIPFGPIVHVPLLPHPDVVQIDGELYKIKLYQSTVVLFDPVIRKGIVKFKVDDDNHLHGIGIADESIRYDRGEEPFARGEDKVLAYFSYGCINHIGESINGNRNFFRENITLELNMDTDPRTLTFFIKDEEQPHFIYNIPAAVRFWTYLLASNSSFKILNFERLKTPSAQHGKDSASWDWEEEWISGDQKGKLSLVKSECLQDVQINHYTYTHTKNNNNDSTILFEFLTNCGAVKIMNISGLLDIGIADQSVSFRRNEIPEAKEFEKIVKYNSNGSIVHIGGKQIEGNKAFGPEDTITLELYMISKQQTVTFFVNDIEQKNYIIDLPYDFRFWCHIKDKGSSFKILSFTNVSKPKAEHKFLSSTKYKWGKKW
ncbi:MAG: putative Serine/threonine-protein kinase Nek3 [Streblomastix strix]|uniref:Putative Serine/threonine-protein kinase Nek3 n=1 Tax=Streblomastix strix TaxID=222440 RepID=A0A5J4VNF1_9EUKA|nr:MAG: putative Serine/threonine-protein kinase Nek3 [Streblomastix strix]